MKTLRRALIAFSSSLLLVSCAATTDSSPAAPVAATPTDGSQNASQLAGTGQFCTTDASLGTALGGMGTTHYFVLGADGTYTYNAYFSDHTGCQTAQNSGGNNVATYTQSGTYTVSGTAGLSPSTITNIIFTMTTSSMTVYATTNALAQDIVAWMNAGCAPSPGFTNSTNSKSLNGNTCTGSGGLGLGTYSAVVLPISGGGIAGSPNPFYNVGYNAGSTFPMGARQDAWRPGKTAYPASVTETYLGW